MTWILIIITLVALWLIGTFLKWTAKGLIFIITIIAIIALLFGVIF